MITRGQMPRQLRNKGGITNVVPREGFIFGGITKRIRKLIPNEIANFASKAAPFVAPFNPGAAALMRGIGRFDKRGSFSDAIKQGLGTFAFGKAAGYLGGAQSDGGIFGSQTFSEKGFSEGPVGRLFQGGKEKLLSDGVTTGAKTDKGVGFIKKGTEMFKDVPILRELPNIVQQQILVGGATAAGSYIYQKFLADEPPQDEGETMEEYLARRKENVGNKMRTYFDNYFKFDPEYSALDDAGKDAFVARYNLKKGGRVGYQTGGITMANTLAENIKRNIANQAAFQQAINPSKQKIVEKLKRSFPVAETLMNVAAPAINLGRGTLGLQDPIGTPSMGDRMKELEATKGPTGSIGYEDYGLPVATPGGRFTGGLPELALSNPVDFALAGSAGRYGFSPEGRTDLKYDFTPDQDTGSTGSALLDFINEGGIKAKVSDLLTPSTAMAAETTPTPDASTIKLPQQGEPGGLITDGGNSYKINEDGMTASLVNQKPTMADVAGPATQGLIPGFTKLENTANLADGDVAYQGPDGQIYGPDTYADIAAGRYPNIYDPNKTLPVEPQTDQDLIEGFAKFKEQNPDAMSGAGMAALVEGVLPGGAPITFSGSTESNAFNKYLESLGLSRANIVKPRENIESLLKSAKLAKGGMPTGIMKTNKAGVMERDYRDKGGFVPVGIKEKADDVPAMLSKNEFVMTANAVRGAGNGSIEKGAQKMYDTMKKLEKRVV